MGRPKNFSRESVLEKAMPVFWKRGFADTIVQDLEKATGVNKSGLYSEFKDKEDLFVESLRYYFSTLAGKDVLSEEPLGWGNIEKFLKTVAQRSSAELKGCFGVATLRELDQLPEEAREIVTENRNQLKRAWIKNIAAEKTKQSPETIAELISTFFSGLCINQNLKSPKSALMSQVEDFVSALKSL